MFDLRKYRAVMFDGTQDWYKVWPKKYRGIIFHDTEESCKISRKTDLWFEKWYEEFREFSPEQTKDSKLGLLLGPFV